MRHSNRLPMLVACLLTGFVATAVSSSGQAQTFRDDEITLHSGQTLLGSVKEKATPKGKELQVQLDELAPLEICACLEQHLTAYPHLNKGARGSEGKEATGVQ